MAVTYDTDVEVGGTNVTSLTVSITVANNPDRYLIVGVAAWDAVSAESAISSVTFNGSGTGWSQIITEVGPGALLDRSSLWGKANPDAVTASVVVTVGGTCSELGVSVLSAYNVNQTTSLGTAVSAEALSSAPSVVVTAATGDLVYDAVYAGGVLPTATVGAGQTVRANITIHAQNNSRLLASTEPGDPTVTSSWTLADTSLEWVQTAVALKAALDLALVRAAVGQLTASGGIVGTIYR